MPDQLYLIAAIVISAAVTWTLRAAPFVFIAPLRRSQVLQEIGAAMPVGVMAILVLYTLRETVVLDPVQIIPVAVGLIVTAGLHIWKSKALLSIGAGTAAHVVLASTLPGLLAGG